MNRSDLSRNYNFGQTPLAQLRPEKLDDAAIKTQISIIQKECGNIDPDSIALILHECDNNLQNTIKRIKAGNFQDSSWQTAKSNNKKKNHHINSTEQMINGNIPSDNERSVSQHTSPTSSIRIHENVEQKSKKYSFQENQSEKQIQSTNDEFQLLSGLTQSLRLDNNPKKSTKRSTIPQEPVSMHSTIQINIQPHDIQFGDVQWNDFVPTIVNSIDDESIQTKTIDFVNQEITNENYQDSTTTNNSTVLPIDGPSHLSDHLNDSKQQQISESTFVPIPTSTPNISPTSQNPNVGNSSAFTPYNTPGTFQSIPREYPQPTSTWNQQTTNYKTNSRPGNYSQQTSYQIATQQPVILGTFPYPTQTFYPLITPVESWSPSGYDPYATYSSTNFIPTYATQQQYPPPAGMQQTTKYDHFSYDKDVFAQYGQSRLTNSEVPNSSQTTKDGPTTSKLSANAASFPQGGSLTTNQPTAYYVNPIVYAVPTYYTTHQDRTISYPSIDTRDNRNGASYSGNHNRNHYHQQQRSNNNSTWHSQQ